MTGFKKIDVNAIKDNPFKLIGEDWMLITAGDKENLNMMTASWGSLGILWHKPVAICYIRPSRYTYELIEEKERFSLCFFPEDLRKPLNFCGSISGRDINKVEESGLIPVFSEKETPGFAESRLILECKKIYFSDLDPKHFLDESISDNYHNQDYHRIYVGLIEACYSRE